MKYRDRVVYAERMCQAQFEYLKQMADRNEQGFAHDALSAITAIQSILESNLDVETTEDREDLDYRIRSRRHYVHEGSWLPYRRPHWLGKDGKAKDEHDEDRRERAREKIRLRNRRGGR